VWVEERELGQEGGVMSSDWRIGVAREDSRQQTPRGLVVVGRQIETQMRRDTIDRSHG
jgi:hypothetical protein